MRLERAAALGCALLLVASAACTEPEVTVPVRLAPPSRHAELIELLREDARSFRVESGDWLEDHGDAPLYALAWLSHRAALGRADEGETARRDDAALRAQALLSDAAAGPVSYELLMAAFGVVEHISASGDPALVAPLDAFLERLDAAMRLRGDFVDEVEPSSELARIGPTATTGLVALLFAEAARLVGGPLAEARLARAREIDRVVRERALADLVEPRTRRQARAYAFAPGELALHDAPNVTMLLLKARLFRVTKEEGFRLQARALHAALRALQISEEPARYASPGAPSATGAEVSTLATQSSIAFALLLLFEITGEDRFVEEADRILDTVGSMRGTWCASDVHRGEACAPACSAVEACVSGACAEDRCQGGLLHQAEGGQLVSSGDDARVFCAGCHFQALYVASHRRALAGELY